MTRSIGKVVIRLLEGNKKESFGETNDSNENFRNEKSLSTTYNSTKEAAMQYAKKGLSVVPLVPRGKIPAVKHRDMPRMTVDDVESYWDAHPQANIALKTERFFCIDVDMHGNENGKKSIEELGHPEWFEGTYAEQTPHGGLHYYFLVPDGLLIRQKIGWLKGVDIRAGENGTVTVTPSIGDNGKRYMPLNHLPMANPKPGLMQKILDDENKEFSNIITDSFAGYGASDDEKERAKTKTTQVFMMISRGLGDVGLRNNNLSTFVGVLLWRGVPIEDVANLALIANKNTPDPLPLREVKETVNSTFRTHMRGLMSQKKQNNN